MTKYKYILFDADGTLFDFELAEKIALENTLNDAGIPYNSDTTKIYNKVNAELWKDFENGFIDIGTLRVERFARLFNIIKSLHDPRKYSDTYIYHLSKGAYLLDGAYDICKFFHGKTSLNIATNGIAEVQKSRLKLSAINGLFDNLFISEAIGYPKPKSKYFNFVFDELGNPDKDEIIIIGDSLSSDIKGGIDAGIDTCYYNPENEPAPSDMDITYVINDLKELKDIII